MSLSVLLELLIACCTIIIFVSRKFYNRKSSHYLRVSSCGFFSGRTFYLVVALSQVDNGSISHLFIKSLLLSAVFSVSDPDFVLFIIC